MVRTDLIFSINYTLSIWYNTDHIENTASNSLSIIACVFVATGKFLWNLFFDTLGGHTHRQQSDILCLTFFINKRCSLKNGKDPFPLRFVARLKRLQISRSTLWKTTRKAMTRTSPKFSGYKANKRHCRFTYWERTRVPGVGTWWKEGITGWEGVKYNSIGGSELWSWSTRAPRNGSAHVTRDDFSSVDIFWTIF
jgi:hypothetical protein